ncbi:MAG: glycosyltransferase [Candidatus Neomarinimicrobiota bacterium]|nr:glycosyltransferase [Candidatus Neomarinimicrobiota bacterium]
MKKKKQTKILILIVTYNAESHIESLLERIPKSFIYSNKHSIKILISDDASDDNIIEVSEKYRYQNKKIPIKIIKNPVNQGYGGNQKIGYSYAIMKNFDIVVLLHGDGQYAPEYIPQLIEPIINGESDVVFGSRMIHKRNALKGGMPLYKFIGNQILTKIQNKILNTNLSEFHSGYRIYSTKALKSIPFQHNSNDFDFDTDIILQILDNKFRIKELPIPTYYGDEISYVNGLKYAYKIIKTTLLFSIRRKTKIYYDPRFEYGNSNQNYTTKVAFPSSHKFAIDNVNKGSFVLDIGCGSGFVARKLDKKSCIIYGIDKFSQNDLISFYKNIQNVNIETLKENTIEFDGPKLDTILMLDIIEHLSNPDEFLATIRNRFSLYNPDIIITTGNIAFIHLRLALLLGKFNYAKKGILDRDHKRLFTFSSLKKTLKHSKFSIEKLQGIPFPFPLIFGYNWFSRLLLIINKLLIILNKRLFSYQIAVIAKPLPTLRDLINRAHITSSKE